MEGAALPFAVAGSVSRTYLPTWASVPTASRWIGSTTTGIANRATAVGQPGSSKCAIAVLTMGNSIRMRSSRPLTCFHQTLGASRRTVQLPGVEVTRLCASGSWAESVLVTASFVKKLRQSVAHDTCTAQGQTTGSISRTRVGRAARQARAPRRTDGRAACR
jgi:hypothetical protein